ncbi:Hypothetical predicted protein [Octopus vulgaris]|uniref:Uncharacterized protein n=1 Tax=Octopus vulgaris TaxID=6645 RepID=A0AA36AR33_OCTVU|nr:Hypothetical predicted protein [Octopus vulgaris]
MIKDDRMMALSKEERIPDRMMNLSKEERIDGENVAIAIRAGSSRHGAHCCLVAVDSEPNGAQSELWSPWRSLLSRGRGQ